MDNIFEIGLSTTITGLVVVFTVLILLVFLIYLFGYVMKNSTISGSDKKDTGDNTQHQEVLSPPQDRLNDEIIAVISAAVACMYEGTGKRTLIRSIKPLDKTQRPIWAMAGLIENTKAF